MHTIAKQTLEPVRLAVLIYSCLVMFPVSFETGVVTNFACCLRELYDTKQVRIFDPELEMWVLAMGCTASWGSNDREWFIKKLKDVVDELCCCHEATHGTEVVNESGPCLEVFLEMMRGFLWWTYGCEVSMREIWEEIYGKRVEVR